MTLIELLVALAIVATLFGVGLAGYRSFAGAMEERALASRVMSLARQARNSTTFEHAPAALTLARRLTARLADPPESVSGRYLGESDGRVFYIPDGEETPAAFDRPRAASVEIETAFRAVGYVTIANWHLEESAIEDGFGGRTLAFEEAGHVQAWLGMGVRLGYDRSGAPRGRSLIKAMPAPDDAFDPFALPGGGRIELRLRADARTIAGGAAIFNSSGRYSLVVLPGGELEGGTPGAVVRTGAYVLSPGVWTKVALTFNPEAVAILADDVLRASALGAGGGSAAPARDGGSELVFGRGFFGEMDEIRVQRRVDGEEVRVPPAFTVSAPDRLVFDERGRLDPAAHSGPARFEFSRDGRSSAFVVRMNGGIESE